jgi:hypothetical protein
MDMVAIIIWLIALFFLTTVHVTAQPKHRNLKGILEGLLLYMFLINVALAGFWAFFAHVFFADEAAKFMGFGPGSPFQYEIGIANLAFGVLGLVCIWERGDFWLATALGYSVFLFGEGIGHVHEMVVNRNYAPGNSGIALWFHLVFPLLLLSVLFIHRYIVHHAKPDI